LRFAPGRGRRFERRSRLCLPVGGFLGQPQAAKTDQLCRLSLMDPALMIHHIQSLLVSW
jgi:hypothetical protein